MRYRLRTLLILVTLLPPILAVIAPPLAQQLLTEPQLARALPGSRRQPVFKIYALHTLDPDSAFQLMKQLYAGTPIRFSLDPKSKSLAVLGSPQNHAEIQNILGILERSAQRHPSQPLEIRQATARSPRSAAEPAITPKPPPDWQYLPLIRPENADQIL